MNRATAMIRLISAASTLVLAALVTSGCSATSAYSSAGTVWDPSTVADALVIAKAQHFSWEVGVLQDGRITAAEYEQAFGRFMDCASKLGYVFKEPKYLDPVEGQLWRSVGTYEGPGKAPSAREQACENRLGLIQDPYVLTTPKRMDPKLLAAFEVCLDGKGVHYKSTDTNFNDFAGNHNSAYTSGPYMDCLDSSMKQVFPNVTAYGVGR
jgi:hypothetical protein